MQLTTFKKILITAALLFCFNVGNASAADSSKSFCRCFNYYGAANTNDITKRINVKEAMVPGVDTKAEESCHQLCANETNNTDPSKRPTIYIFRTDGTEKKITKTPGVAITEAPINFCSCDNGVPQTKEIILRSPVETEEGCIFMCSEAQGATRYRFGIGTGNGMGEWKAIPAPIGSVSKPQAKIFKYQLLESFPGFFVKDEVLTDFPKMILAIYKFGIWVVGIAGLFMLVIGGFTYMTSAGNSSTAGTGKSIVIDALIGIVAALAAYLIMYVINPDLTKLNMTFKSVDVTGFGGPTGTGNPSPQSANCKTDAMLSKIKNASQGKLDPCLTFALLNTESGCNANAQSSANACGVAQMMPDTAGISCDELKKNVDTSISKGIAYLLSNERKIRGSIRGGVGNSFAQAAMDLYAGYNGGAGALTASTDCAGRTNSFGFPYKRWDCPIDPGKGIETQVAAPRFLNSFNACNDDAVLQAKLK